MLPRCIVATSIVPRNIELQQSAISSWQSLGFELISINSPTETNLIRQYFPSVEFISVHRTAEQSTGRPYVYFDDVCMALAESGADICGIINSDIHLYPAVKFKDFISREAEESFLFGSRIDVKTPENRDGEIYFYGFDFFFFNKSLLACYPSSEFCLGAPWWDYWAPMVPLIQGIQCKEIISPLAYHLWHETKWAPDLFNHFGDALLNALQKRSKTVNLNSGLESVLSDVIGSRDFNIFSFKILQYILGNARQIVLDTDCANDNRVNIGLCQFESMRRFMIDRKSDCLIAEKEIETLKAAVSEGNKRLENIKKSFSWRLTAPLRKMLDALGIN